MPREIQTAVQIANAALRILQSRPIESFDEESSVAQTVKLYYNNVLRRCLAAYPWAFSQTQAELEQLPKQILPQWKFSYKLPPDFVSLVWLRSGVGDRPSWHELHAHEVVAGNIVCANVGPPIFARYQYEAPVAFYPHYFIELLVSSLVEELSAVFGHNLNTQAIYQRRVNGPGGILGQAILEERRQNPPRERHAPPRLAMERNW